MCLCIASCLYLCIKSYVCVSALLLVFSALQRRVSSPSEVVCAFAYSVNMCASTLQVVFVSTLLVVCSWGEEGGGGGGGHVALSFRRSDQCCVSLVLGHAGMGVIPACMEHS